jgi:transposase InsO family protein
VNHKRVHRVYRAAGLMIRRKKRKHCVREGKPLLARTSANQEWALDFLHDAVECGRAIRVLSVVGAYTRECVAKHPLCVTIPRGVVSDATGAFSKILQRARAAQ